MGEYLCFNGRQYKIGTCESLYYIRHDELKEIAELHQRDESGTLITDYLQPKIFFYRFPWPDEDGQDVSYSDNRDYSRKYTIANPGIETAHNTVACHIKAEGGGFGLNVMIPCPADTEAFKNSGLRSSPINITPLHIAFEKYDENGSPLTILGCGYCRQMFRITEDDAEKVRAAVLRKDNAPENPNSWHKKVAARIFGASY